jgi:dolichol-phosphate mannosyltransferase
MAALRPTVFVIPAYNEAENIPFLLEDLGSRPWLFTMGSRVIVVDDGSDDETCAAVRAYDGAVPVELLELAQNMGPGAAFRAGFKAALTDCPDDAFIITLEADRTSDLDMLPAMIARAAAGADLVLASVHGGGQMLNVSPLRKLLSRGAGAFTRLLLGIDAKTVSSFFRVYRVSALRAGFERHGDQFIREPGFACKAEILAKLVGLGIRVDEIPVNLDASLRAGESKMQILPTLMGYFRLVARDRLGKASARA